ncbi:hypothetical protein AB0E21_29170 [Streptomyces sp. NPDC047967]|uniref:hypothetical protein n=1 Tax=Streptomyces sp. NPDC047967 TaxID=3154924 RepID=UPI0033FFE8A0
MNDRSSWESRKLRYWSECSGRSRRGGLRSSHPAPRASPEQARLESFVLKQLGTLPDLCAHPFGISSLSSSSTSLTLHLDAYVGLRQYSFPEYCLSRLLPADPGNGDDPHGIPGVRVSGIGAGGRQLLLDMVGAPGQGAALVLVLPEGLTEGWEDIERRHRQWCEASGVRPLWTAAWRLDPVESRYRGAYCSFEGSRAGQGAVGSALLRRIALFHTVTAFYRVQCWDDGGSWKIDARTAHPRARWHDQLLRRLCHPRWGLPARVTHRFCHCAEPDTSYQWDHTCAFYFGCDTTSHDDPLYLRVHASPEGHDYDRQIAALKQVGAPASWMARAFPQQALEPHAHHRHAERLL